MRVIRLAPPPTASVRLLAVAGAMLLVGAVAAVLAITGPRGRPDAVAILAIAAALGLGVGASMVAEALRSRKRRGNEDLVRLLGPTLTDAYLLLLDPKLAGVPSDVAALLVGPPGVRALLVRRWIGRYRVRGRGWEYDTHSRRGWIPCITNPSYEGAAAREALSVWARTTADEPNLPLEAAIAFPSKQSHLVLEEPEDEIITIENAPWWAQSVGGVQRMDGPRAVRFVQAVMAERAQPSAVRRRARSP
jgi:hypothetical protein